MYVDIFIRTLRVIFRTFLFAAYAIWYLARGFRIHYFVKDPYQRKLQFSQLSTWVTGLCCKSFGIRVQVVNAPSKNARGLIVGNHLGFIDILATGSIRPILFVTSMEMRRTPVLGILTEMGGCIYVNRLSRMGIQDELAEIIESLKQGFNVCLFPEATSHNGEHVLPFKRTLLTSAAYASVPIFPYVFNFKSIDGEEFTFKNRDNVCWYGDIPFLTAMVSAFSLKYVDVEIKFLEPVYTTVDMERAVVANKLHNMISAEFHPVKPVQDSILLTTEEGI